MIRTSAGSPRSRRTGIAFAVVPIEGPYAIVTLWPERRSNSGTRDLNAAVIPPEIMTWISAAWVAVVRRIAAETARPILRRWVDKVMERLRGRRLGAEGAWIARLGWEGQRSEVGGHPARGPGASS